MEREIIKIDEEKCNGCGLCIPACPEGALQIIDNKARLVSDLMCDGLGACIGECPEGAIEIEVREAEPYDEIAVMKEMVKHGKNTVAAHLKHLQDHGEFAFLEQAVGFLKQNKSEIDFNIDDVMNIEEKSPDQPSACGCPGSAMMSFDAEDDSTTPTDQAETGEVPSQLRQWPVQMHLINPNAAYFQGADVVLAADCAAFSLGDFHRKFIKGKSIAIACPKLDQGQEIYVNKLIAMIDEAKINTLEVVIMEVPCCSGLLQLAAMARQNAKRNIPVKQVVVGIRGEVIKDEWM